MHYLATGILQIYKLQKFMLLVQIYQAYYMDAVALDMYIEYL